MCNTWRMSLSYARANLLSKRRAKREKNFGRGEAMLKHCIQRETDLSSYPPSALLLPQAPLLPAFLLVTRRRRMGQPCTNIESLGSPWTRTSVSCVRSRSSWKACL